MTKLVKLITKLMFGLPNILQKLILLLCIIFTPGRLIADEQKETDFQFTGVLLANAAILYSEDGDIGYNPEKKRSFYNSDEESIRFITTGHLSKNLAWEVQYFNQRSATDLPVALASNDINLFRIKSSRHYFIQDNTGEHQANWYHEIDRMFTKYEYANYSAVIGRQAISWGSGRFWQPTDVFGAFSPIELDREYKPGIDAIKFDYFPSHASSLALTYVPGNRDIENFKDSAALHYRAIIGQESEITLLAGKISGIATAGGSFESSWSGMGWRLESILFEHTENDNKENFSIAGLDYQFNDDLLVSLEMYYNSLGATTEEKLAQSANQVTYINGQQKHLGQNVVGISFSKSMTPLLTGNYNFLLSKLESADKETNWSSLHQIFFSYSLADEADALLAFHYGNGKGLDNFGQPRSEFGHVPASLSLRLRAYF